jgi:murein DD-endopeptidase MepM/ murein hydrolase activator NlpD
VNSEDKFAAYANLESVSVKKDEIVSKGMILGTAAPGRNEKHRLHFEFWISNSATKKANPLDRDQTIDIAGL